MSLQSMLPCTAGTLYIYIQQSTINTTMNYMIIGPGLLSILSFAIRVTFFNQLWSIEHFEPVDVVYFILIGYDQL